MHSDGNCRERFVGIERRIDTDVENPPITSQLFRLLNLELIRLPRAPHRKFFSLSRKQQMTIFRNYTEVESLPSDVVLSAVLD